jgi:WD40 repeat protein
MSDGPPAGAAPSLGEALARQAESLWRRGQRPDPDRLLAAAGVAAPSAVAAVLAVDQWQRWHSGERVAAEDYLARHPGVAAEAACALLVVYGEFLVREELGEAPAPDDYLARFPLYADALRAQFGFHAAVAGAGVAATLRDDCFATLACREPAPPSGGGRLRSVPGYDVLEELGRGGMGVVYKARQEALDRVVALKMVLAAGGGDAEQRARFRAEALAVARLRHPNIVQVYEVGEHEGHPFIALEFVEGGSLARHLASGPLPPGEAAALAEAVARAMHHAHQAGVVHRDLKPANILLQVTSDEWRVTSKEPDAGSALATRHSSLATPKVADFGLARRLDEAGQTQTGQVMGTPSYMAPEQASGRTREVGPATDVYALGAVLYECLVGRPPFQGADVFDTLDQVRSREPVPPRTLQPKVPRDLETVCLRCLHKEPDRRYKTAEALADDLRRFLEGRPVLARPVGRAERAVKWARRRPLAAALLLVVVVAAAGAAAEWGAFTAQLGKEKAAAEHARDDAVTQKGIADGETARANQKTGELETALDDNRRALGRNTLLLAQAAWRENDGPRARALLDEVPEGQRRWEWHYLRGRYQGGLFTCYGHTRDVLAVAFRFDGRRLASAGEDGIARVWDAATGQPLLALPGFETNMLRAVAYSPDGRRLATGGRDGVVRLWDADAGTLLTTLKGPGGQVVNLDFAPDGRLAAGFTPADGARAPAPEVRVWGPAGGEPLVTVKPPGRALLSCQFVPGGGRLATVCWVEGAKIPGGGISVEYQGKVWEAATGRELQTLAGCSCLAFSPDGRQTALGERRQVVIRDAATAKALVTIPSNNDRVEVLAFSPDGRQVAWGGRDGAVRLADVADGQSRRAYVGHGGNVMSVAFSPDGRFVASAAGPVVKLWPARDQDDGPDFVADRGSRRRVALSPDGKRLAVGGYRAEGRPRRSVGQVGLWDVPRNTFLPLGEQGEEVTAVALSPDGSLLASGGDDGSIKLWNGGKESRTLRAHPGKVSYLAFSPDGGRLASVGWKPGADDEPKVWDARTGELLHDLRGHPGGTCCVAFAPSGTALASGGADGAVRLWDAEGGQELWNVRAATRTVLAIAFSADGRLLAAGGSDNSVRVWDAREPRELLVVGGFKDQVTGLAFTPDGERLVASSLDGMVRILDARDGGEVLALRGTDNFGVDGLVVARDGSTIAGCNNLANVFAWLPRAVPEVRALSGHALPAANVTFSPDGQRLAAGGEDRTVRVWDVPGGKSLLTLRGHAGDLRTFSALRFSPDGGRLFSGDTSGKEFVWDLASGEAVALPVDHWNWKVYNPSPDGPLLALADGKVVRLIDLGRPDEAELARRLRATRPDADWHAREAASGVGGRDAGLFHARWAAFYEAESGEWAQAIGALQQLAAGESDPVTTWLDLARTQLAAGQANDYRQTCERLLKMCNTNGAPPAAVARLPEVIRVCALRPDTVNANTYLNILQKRFNNDLARAAAVLRAGRPALTLQKLGEDRGPYALLLRALAEHGCGRPDAARQALGQAVAWMDGAPEPARWDGTRTRLAELPWQQRLDLDVLRREAEALLRGN